MRRLLTLIACLALALALAPAAHAAKPPTGTMTVTGDFVHGGTILVHVDSDAVPLITHITCSQDGVAVLAGGSLDYSTYGDQDFILDSDPWISGPAECVIELVTFRSNGREVPKPLDVFEFAVSG